MVMVEAFGFAWVEGAVVRHEGSGGCMWVLVQGTGRRVYVGGGSCGNT